MSKARVPETRIDEQLFRLLKNSGQLAALVILIERKASPSDIASELGMKLNQVSYNIKELKRMGAIEGVGTERRRGQVAHLYRAIMRPIWRTEEWAQLSQDERERYAAWVIQLFLRDVAIAWGARTFQARADAHTSRRPLVLDEEGWRRVNEIMDEALIASREVEVESQKRTSETGSDTKTIVARAAMFCIEVPPQDTAAC